MSIDISSRFNYERLFRFVLPSVVMMIFISTYTMVDGFFVSNYVGKTAFASVNLIMQTLTRVFSLADAPSPGFWLIMLPTGWSLYCSVWLPRPSFRCTSRVRASFTFMPMRLGTLVVVATCGRLT